MARLVVVVVGFSLIVIAVGSADATRTVKDPVATSRGFAVQVGIPGQPGASAGSVAAPPDAVAAGESFAYPADGSVVSTGSVTSGAFAAPGDKSTSSASADASTISIFGGEVTATAVSVKSKASARMKGSSSDSAGSVVTGLTIQGQPIASGTGTQFPLGDWGTVTTLQAGTASLDGVDQKGARAFVSGLDVRLVADHYGLPAGTEIIVGYAEALAKVGIGEKADPRRHSHVTKKPTKPKRTKRPAKKPVRGPGVAPEKPSLTVRPPPDVTPRLTAGGYVFPVYGASSFGDTFGGFRPDVSGGWHHGEDIFAPLGSPILAVADGTIFSVGWNDIGGYRFWLRDHAGNEFYYAHLSAYSPNAINGKQVKAGAVIGFVGNTGDAETTPYHLHFEIHPVSMLYLGYDGAVRPYAYLMAWKRLEDLAFAQVAGWAPPVSATSSAPKPGAILLSSTDISTADGLVPGALEKALREARTPAG